MTEANHIPAALHISNFDDNDDDVFDDKDDNPENLAYAFSPEALREELAKNLPEIHEQRGVEDYSSFSSAGPFEGSDKNPSVSTIDLGPSVLPSQDLSHTESSVTDPSDLTKFTRISLSESAEDGDCRSNTTRTWNSESQQLEFGIRQAARPPSLDLTREPPLSSPTHVDPFMEGSSHLITPSPRSTSKFSAFSTASEHSPSLQSPNSINSAGLQATTSTSLPDVSTVPATSNISLTKNSFSHRPHRPAGPSTFEKVRSKTRPTFLPPKSRKEDDKHMSDWQHMMKQSRVIGTVCSPGPHI